MPSRKYSSWTTEGHFIRLACIVLILALEIVGVALADNAADEEQMVDNGTMALVTIVQGSLFTADQSVEGTGFANVYKRLEVVDPSDKSQVLIIKNLGSGTGAYSDSSYIYVQNNTYLTPAEDFESSDHNITLKDDITAVYSPVSFQFPGSFKANTIKSLWKDQTYSKNYANMVTMDSLFDYSKALTKESTTTMYSTYHKYQDYIGPGTINATAWSKMAITSNFEGSAHLGAILGDVRGGNSGIVKSKAQDTVLMDEDYRGSFNLTKKMAVTLKKSTDYGNYETNYDGYDGDYPWLPCICNTGWNDMIIHDQRYHSAKGFFDCTSCLPPGPCKN